MCNVSLPVMEFSIFDLVWKEWNRLELLADNRELLEVVICKRYHVCCDPDS